jgi:hypothetical protein
MAHFAHIVDPPLIYIVIEQTCLKLLVDYYIMWGLVSPFSFFFSHNQKKLFVNHMFEYFYILCIKQYLLTI